MKVLKFGGTSVGSHDGILRVKSITASQTDATIVVVSAFSRVTDGLISAARTAEKGDDSYHGALSEMRSRHRLAIDELVPEGAKKDLAAKIDAMIDRVESLCDGVAILKVLPEPTLDEIVSYGERMSSLIISEVIPGSVLYDALDFMRTRKQRGKHVADTESTYRLIREHFSGFGKDASVGIVPGFIARDSDGGEITNLGRGGSDYTASLIAAALDAEVLEIWTDVDGFMTADPKIIKTSYVIPEISYDEAMELCNFGAKVVYPPTLYAVCTQGIPIVVRNTFNIDSPGTTIKRDCSPGDRLIRGVSSLDDISLITLSGTSMVGIVGVDSRIFATLARENISAFLVSQSASETGITIGVSRSLAELAREVIDKEFAHEIGSGANSPVKVQNDVAVVTIVGQNMRSHVGVAGKLFSTLGRNGISIIAVAQGASETNISLVVARKNLRKALNVIHDSFFLSEYQELNLFICGVGTVGSQLVSQIVSQREKLMRERNLKINIVGIARSNRGIFDRAGVFMHDDAAEVSGHPALTLENYRERICEIGIPIDTGRLRDEVIGMNIFNSVFVDCTASEDVAGLYGEFFNHGISVVTANKIAASSAYSNYRDLKDTALRRNVKFLFETNVGAGLPIINTINDLRNSGDKILRLEAVLSGTLNFIFNTISADVPFSQTVRMAQEQGFSEPDPRIDLSGKDVIRKLVILSREAGYVVNQEDVEAELFIPKELFDCDMDEFWRRLPQLDADFEERRRQLEKENKRWRFVATMDGGKCSVALRAVENSHSFYMLDGSNNIVLLTTERYNRHPMLIQGYGAGAEVTAAGVFADIMRIANI